MADVKDLAQSANSGLPAQRKQFETVHSLLLPLYKDIMLLPNAAVAEIIAYTEPESVEDAPAWFLGNMTWRDRRIPLISFEIASDGEAGSMHKNCRIAVLNTLNGNVNLPYIAVVTQGLPSLQVVKPNSVQYADNSSELRQSVKAYVNLSGTAALIPDLDELESRIVRLHK